MADQSDLVSELINSPVFLLILTLTLFSLVVVFLLPLLKLKIVTSLLDLRSRKLLSHPVQVIAGVLIIVLLVGVGYWFYLQGKPQMITAGQLNNKEKDSLSYIQNNTDYYIIENSDMYLLDLRSEEEYSKEHIKGSFSSPYEEVNEKINMPTDKKIVVYSSQGKFDESRVAGEIIKGKVKAEVYIVKGGYKALKGEGLKVEEGWLR